MRAPAPAPSSHRQPPLSVSPPLLPNRCQDSPSAPLSFSPTLITAEPQAQDSELGLQLGLQSLSAADAWTVPLKDDPWAEQSDKIATAGMSVDTLNRSMQLDGNDSMSFGDTITCSRQNEEESVHGTLLAPPGPCMPPLISTYIWHCICTLDAGNCLSAYAPAMHGGRQLSICCASTLYQPRAGAHAFQRNIPQRMSRSGLTRSPSFAPAHGSHPFQLAGNSIFSQAGLSIPGARSACHGLPASHSPHLEEGILAQSLEAAIPHGESCLPLNQTRICRHRHHHTRI